MPLPPAPRIRLHELLVPVANNKDSPIGRAVVPPTGKLYTQPHSWRRICVPHIWSPGVLETIRLTVPVLSCGHIVCRTSCSMMSSATTYDLPSRWVPCMLGSIDQEAGLFWTETALTLEDIRDPVAAKTRFLIAYGILP